MRETIIVAGVFALIYFAIKAQQNNVTITQQIENTLAQLTHQQPQQSYGWVCDIPTR